MSEPMKGLARRVPLSLRTTADLRAALERAADRNGRSLTQEVEFRLERSLMGDDLRQIVREEIAASRSSKLPADWLGPVQHDPIEGPIPVQVFGRDHLPS